VGYHVLVTETLTYAVPAIHCEHCAMSIREEVEEVAGVDDVLIDLETKVVTVSGRALDDAALRAAIEEAGYQAA
jgi:copper chaperone